MHLLHKILFIIGLFFITPCMAQPDTCHLRISLLTCGPGADLYSIWGHTGIRVIDSSHQADVVFNYGTFNDQDPLFYVKFTRGIMIYSVTPMSFQNFMEEYREGARSVTEQVLALDCTTKARLLNALWTNTEKQNKDYPYHFYADNCTTRARDMLAHNMDTAVLFKEIRPAPGISTYRQLIHSYMTSSSQAWNRFTIDILLGKHLDETPPNYQAMFLPDFLMKGLDSASLHQHALVGERTIILPDGQVNEPSLFTPTALFSLLLMVTVALSFISPKWAGQTLLVTESLVFLLIGLLGVLMLVLWLARVDTVCRNNYNLLWALPTHTIIAFVINKQKKWVKSYWLLTAAISALLLLSWHWLPQDMNNSLLVLIALQLFISTRHYLKLKNL